MINKNEQTFLKKKLPMYIKMASSVSLVVGAMGVATHAYAAEAATDTEEVVITGQRASIESAQQIKKNASVIVDSIVAEDIGKLPDRSVTDALQRVPGVSVNRYDTMGDPEHFSGEGSGVAIRGLTQVRSELNGRDIFSANDARGLSFEDVPAELMAGVDVYKSPSADMIEGGLGGTVNLRTRMPFDSAGQVASVTIKANYGDQIKETNGEYSGLYSNRWETDAGEFGFLIDLSTSDLSSRADNLYQRAYMPRTDVVAGKTVYVPKGADWRRNDFHRTRNGEYVAFQWAPTDEVEVYLTGFRSKHDSQWDENGFFIDQYAGLWAPVPVSGASDWAYDSKGALASGTTTTASNKNGISFGTSTRLSHSISTTTDYSTGIKWSPDDHWKFNADLQYVKSEATKEDYTLGLIVFPNKVAYKNLDGTPQISIDNAYLANANNYSYGQMMTLPGLNDADQTSFKIDGEYSIDDSIIKSIKAGARFTDKSAISRSASSWAANYQPWQVNEADWAPFHNATQLPKVSAANAASTLVLKTFDNFQRGNASVPVAAYMYQPELLKNFHTTTDTLRAASPGGCCGINWVNADVQNPDNINTQDEKTESVFAMTNFGFDNLSMPIDGNFGLRAIKTENIAHGKYTITGLTLPDDPATPVVEAEKPFDKPATEFNAEHSYTSVLPSLNVRMKATDELFFRFAASKALWAPAFSQLAAKTSAKVDWASGVTANRNPQESELFRSITMSSNPELESMKAKQYDLSAEWYFDEHGGMMHAAIFKKNISDLFVTKTGSTIFDGHTYVTKRLENGGTGEIKGLEVGVSKFFDTLPAPFNGLGVEANYTRVDSSMKLSAAAAALDTDGSTYGNVPMEGLSKDTYNLVAMFEKDGISARLAYNWRSKYLVAVGPNGWNGNDNNISWKLPVYNDAYGQLDASIGYTFLDNYTVTFEASNLSKSNTKGVIEQNGAGNHTAYVYSQDVRYALSLRAKF
jgi:iron complex outermembrane receptor protein